jgi:hypothetical protein
VSVSPTATHRLASNIPLADWEELKALALKYHAGSITAAVISAVRAANQMRSAAATGQLVIRGEDGREQLVVFL